MIKKICIIIVLIAISLLPFARISFAANKTYIGILPFYQSDKIWLFYKPFIEYLNKTTDMSWELKLYHNYDAIIDGICSNEISIAYLGPIPFGLAYEKCKAKPLLVVLGNDERPFYRSVIFTSDPKIRSIKDLKGKKVALGDKKSTAAYIVPLQMLEDEGINLDMIEPLLFNTHDRVIKAVLNNEASGGAVKESAFENFRSLNLKKIKESMPLPHFAFCAYPGIDPVIEKSFIKALTLKPLKNKTDMEITKDWDPELRHGFTLPPQNYIQEVERLLRLYKKRE